MFLPARLAPVSVHHAAVRPGDPITDQPGLLALEIPDEQEMPREELWWLDEADRMRCNRLYLVMLADLARSGELMARIRLATAGPYRPPAISSISGMSTCGSGAANNWPRAASLPNSMVEASGHVWVGVSIISINLEMLR